MTFLDYDDYVKERATSGCSRTEDLRVFVKKIVSGRFYDVARNSLRDNDDDDDDDDRKSRPAFAVTI